MSATTAPNLSTRSLVLTPSLSKGCPPPIQTNAGLSPITASDTTIGIGTRPPNAETPLCGNPDSDSPTCARGMYEQSRSRKASRVKHSTWPCQLYRKISIAKIGMQQRCPNDVRNVLVGTFLWESFPRQVLQVIKTQRTQRICVLTSSGATCRLYRARPDPFPPSPSPGLSLMTAVESF